MRLYKPFVAVRLWLLLESSWTAAVAVELHTLNRQTRSSEVFFEEATATNFRAVRQIGELNGRSKWMCRGEGLLPPAPPRAQAVQVAPTVPAAHGPLRERGHRCSRRQSSPARKCVSSRSSASIISLRLGLRCGIGVLETPWKGPAHQCLQRQTYCLYSAKASGFALKPYAPEYIINVVFQPKSFNIRGLSRILTRRERHRTGNSQLPTSSII